MKKFTLITSLFLVLHCNSQQWAWARQANLTTGHQKAKDVCADNMGNVFIIGENQDTAYYGGTVLDSGSFVAKYSSSGALLWAKKLPGDVKDIACDGIGNIYLVGNFTTSISFGSYSLTSNGQSDFYLTKFNSTGNVISANSYGGQKKDDVVSIAIDNSDNIFITGSFQDSISFGSNKLKYIATNSYYGGKLFYLVKISSGNIAWARTCPYNYSNNPYQYRDPLYLRVDKNGSAYITGEYDVFLGCQMYCSAYFITRYDPAGNLTLNNRKWDVYEYPYGLAVDDSLNILVEYNCGTHYTWCRTLVKYDSLLNTKWGKYLGNYAYGTNYTFIYGLSVDSQCNIYVAGLLGGQGMAGDTVILCNDTLKGKGATDILAGKFNPSGNCEWVITAGGNGEENFLGYNNPMYVDKNGNCYLTGNFNSNYWSPGVQNEIVHFSTDSLQSDGNWQQIYLAKINSINPVAVSAKQEANTEELLLKIFPNPSSGLINTFVSQPNIQTNIQIKDVFGKIVLNEKNARHETQLDLRSLPKGIYFLEAENEKGKTVKKIILQ